jgi:hypothetical protein
MASCCQSVVHRDLQCIEGLQSIPRRTPHEGYLRERHVSIFRRVLKVLLATGRPVAKGCMAFRPAGRGTARKVRGKAGAKHSKRRYQT